MPIGDFGSAPNANATPQDLADSLARLQKEIQYLLNGGLDTLNVLELDAEVIIARTITADKISADSITANEIAANAITADEIAANAVTAIKIIAGAIETAKIAAGAVTADKITVSQLSAISANIGNVTAGTISASTTINVGTDATIYQKLYFNANSFITGIEFAPGIEVYHDPASGALQLNASGGVYANGVFLA